MTSPSLRYLSPLLALLFALACSAPSPDDGVLYRGARGLYSVVITSTHVGFLEGAEASTDPERVGVDVRVIDRAGALVLEARADAVVRGMALHEDALATLELDASSRRRVIVRALDGSPAMELEHPRPPVALAVTERGFAWIEIRGVSVEDSPFGSLGVFELTLVESDSAGAIQSRVVLTPPEPIRAPISLVTPWPTIGLLVGGAEARIWTRSFLCGGGSLAYGFDRESGAGERVWAGRFAETSTVASGTCECADVEDNVSEQVTAVGASSTGASIVAGNIYPCASLAGTQGFVVVDGVTLRAERTITDVAFHDGEVFLAVGAQVLAVEEGALVDLGIAPGGALHGLAIDETSIVFATSAAIVALPR